MQEVNNVDVQQELGGGEMESERGEFGGVLFVEFGWKVEMVLNREQLDFIAAINWWVLHISQARHVSRYEDLDAERVYCLCLRVYEEY